LQGRSPKPPVCARLQLTWAARPPRRPPSPPDEKLAGVVLGTGGNLLERSQGSRVRKARTGRALAACGGLGAGAWGP
jgi:hypothetical protein